MKRTKGVVIDITNKLYCIDKDTGEKHLVDGINFPLGSPSGKDITIVSKDNLLEWRAIDDVEFLNNMSDEVIITSSNIKEVVCSITDIDVFQDLLNVLMEVIKDDRIDKGIRYAYLDRLAEIIDLKDYHVEL